MPYDLTIDETPHYIASLYICNHRSAPNHKKIQRLHSARTIYGHDLVHMQTYMGYAQGLIYEVFFKRIKVACISLCIFAAREVGRVVGELSVFERGLFSKTMLFEVSYHQPLDKSLGLSNRGLKPGTRISNTRTYDRNRWRVSYTGTD